MIFKVLVLTGLQNISLSDMKDPESCCKCMYSIKGREKAYGWLPKLWLERAGEQHLSPANQRVKGSGQWLRPAQKVIEWEKGR